MKKATLYQEYLQSSREAAEHRLSLLREENLIYNGMMPEYQTTGGSSWASSVDDDYASRSMTQSKYLSPDYHLAVDTYAESMMYNFPSFEFEGNQLSFSKEEMDTLNSVFSRVAFANSLTYKMMSVLRTGIRKGFCACELVPTEIVSKRQIKVDGKWVEDKETTYTGVLDLIRYLPSQTFIDPNADPDDIRGTAEYCIAYLGFFSKAAYREMAKRYNWEDNNKIEEVFATSFTDDGGDEQEKNAEGIQRQKGVKVSKLFLLDGTVQVVVNDEHVVHEAINSKRISRMPLIFYRALPGGSTPYGPLLWQRMRPSVMALSAATNLILDNVGKSLCSPIFHNVRELQNVNINDYENGELVYVKNMEEMPMEKAFHQIRFDDMTQGAQYALAKFSSDVSRISRLDSLSQGTQGEQQIRTNAIAEKLSQPSISQKSAFVKQAEFSFFQEFGRDMLSIFYAFYDDFEEIQTIERKKLADIRSVRVRQGSTLEEDAMSKVQKMNAMIQLLLSTQEDGFSLDKAFTDYFKAIGINDPDWYKLPLDQQLMAAYVKAGIDPNVAKQEIQRILGQTNAKVQ